MPIHYLNQYCSIVNWTLRTSFSEILIGIQIFSFKKMLLKMSSAKWCPFSLGFNVLKYDKHFNVGWLLNRGMLVIVQYTQGTMCGLIGRKIYHFYWPVALLQCSVDRYTSQNVICHFRYVTWSLKQKCISHANEWLYGPNNCSTPVVKDQHFIYE